MMNIFLRKTSENILFVESPIQLVNAFEAKSFFKMNSYTYYIRLSGVENNDIQLIKLIKILNLSNVKLIYLNAYNKKIIDYLKLFYYKYFYRLSSNKRVFIGNYDSGFFTLVLKKLKKEQVVLLDDGAKTIDTYSKFKNNFHYDLFTIYDLEALSNQKIYKNKYVQLEKKLSKLSKNKNEILFLGSKLSEIEIISENYYLEIMKKIAYYYKNNKVIYIAHREESQSKLDKITLIKNISVVQLDYPIELYGIYSNNIPYKVSSFYSTAIYTIKNIYNIEAESFIFDYSKSEYKKSIDNVYEYYRKYIKIIDIDAYKDNEQGEYK